MALIVGTREYGKVDAVRGVFHVATDFLHLNYFPLIPLRSRIIPADGSAEEAVPIRLSHKSVLVAWIRACLVVFLVVCVAALIVVTSKRLREDASPEHILAAVIVGMVFTGVPLTIYWATHRLTRARRARALELADLLGVPREVVEEKFPSRQLSPTHNWADVAPRRWPGMEERHERR